MRYWEDFSEGETVELGSHTFERAEIVEFAERFDPQSFHVDEEAASRSPFGGLIASGWHTASVCMRLYVDALLGDSSSMGSPGVEQLRWTAPVRPGDTVSASVTVVETRASSTRPGRGTVVMQWEAINQRGEVVLRMLGRGLFGRRPS